MVIGWGEMGRLLGGVFERGGCAVQGIDEDGWSGAAVALEHADLALVCVPIDRTASVIAHAGPLLGAGAVLADITSTKVEPVRAMLKSYGGAVLGLHPMFGPGVRSLRGQTVVAVPARDESGSRWVLDVLRADGALVTLANAETHDRAMVSVQAIRHFATLALGSFLAERGEASEASLAFSSPIYRIELSLIQRLLAQNPALYADIILADPERVEAIAAYAERVGELASLVRAGDRDGLIAAFERASERSDMDRDRVLRETQLIIDALAESIAAQPESMRRGR